MYAIAINIAKKDVVVCPVFIALMDIACWFNRSFIVIDFEAVGNVQDQKFISVV